MASRQNAKGSRLARRGIAFTGMLAGWLSICCTIAALGLLEWLAWRPVIPSRPLGLLWAARRQLDLEMMVGMAAIGWVTALVGLWLHPGFLCRLAVSLAVLLLLYALIVHPTTLRMLLDASRFRA